MFVSDKSQLWRTLFYWPLELIGLTAVEGSPREDDWRYWIGIAGFIVQIAVPTVFLCSFMFGFSPWWTLAPLALYLGPLALVLAAIKTIVLMLRLYGALSEGE